MAKAEAVSQKTLGSQKSEHENIHMHPSQLPPPIQPSPYPFYTKGMLSSPQKYKVQGCLGPQVKLKVKTVLISSVQSDYSVKKTGIEETVNFYLLQKSILSFRIYDHFSVILQNDGIS